MVKTDRSLGGFYGETAGEVFNQKKALLEKEGVAFDAQERVNEACIYAF